MRFFFFASSFSFRIDVERVRQYPGKIRRVEGAASSMSWELMIREMRMSPG